MPAQYKPVDPAKQLRDLRQEFKYIQQDKLASEPGPERAAALADFIKRSHDMRQLNFVMHAAPVCLEHDGDPPQALVRAYTEAAEDDEERLRAYSELADLGRWIGNDELVAIADEQSREQAPTWVASVEGAEQRRRLRDLGSMFSREFADQVRDQIGL
ncbi:MAG TPA: hypothetical protein VGA69_01720 [Nitriliruptorales bacterium]